MNYRTFSRSAELVLCMLCMCIRDCVFLCVYVDGIVCLDLSEICFMFLYQ